MSSTQPSPEAKKDGNSTNSSENCERKKSREPSQMQHAVENAISAAMGSAVGSLINSAFQSFFSSSDSKPPNFSSTSNQRKESEEIACDKLKESLLKCLQTNFTNCEEVQREFKECLIKHSLSSK